MAFFSSKPNMTGFRSVVANLLSGRLTRRMSASDRAQAQPLPASMTQAGAQAAHAQQLYQASLASNRGKKKPQAQQAQLNAGTIDNPTLQDTMVQNQAPQARPVSLFAPGAPLAPAVGIEPPEGARQFEYQPGYNIASLPRHTESTSFAQLRAIAFLCDAVQIAEQVYFDIFARMQLHVGFEEGTIPDGQAETDQAWKAIAQPARDWLMYPDGQTHYSDWMSACWRDVAELGYSTIFLRRNRKGDIISLDYVDASTMKPLIDERGRQPRPPFPAWQQFLWGVPAGRYTSEQIYCIREAARTDSVYPISRVERILLRLNMLLRKENLDMTRFTDGAIPEGVIIPPDDGTTDWTDGTKAEEYERTLNGLMAGNDRRRVRLKVIPPGSKYINTRPQDPQTAFDLFLYTIVAAAFGLTLEEMAFTENSNKSTGQTQQNVTYRRAVEPVAKRFAELFTWVIKQRFDQRLVVRWKGMEEPEDILVKAQALNIGVQAAAISPSRMAQMMKWPVDVETPPFVRAPGEPIFLDQMMQVRDQQLAAKQAGLQLAIQNPGAAAKGTAGISATGQEHEQQQEQAAQTASQKPSAPSSGAPSGTASAGAAAPASGATSQPASATREGEKPQAGASPHGAPAKGTAQTAPNQARSITPEDIRADYRRWYTVASKAVKDGRPVPRFVTDVIPPEEYAQLAADLATCRTPEGVQAAFARARAREALPMRRLKPVGTVDASQYQGMSVGVSSVHRQAYLDLHRIFEEVNQHGHHTLVA
jgi:hypothetical protein